MARRKPKPNEVTVVGSELISWALPRGDKSGRFEMLNADDLLTRKGWPIYREMKADDQIKASLWFKKTLISARAWDIKPASDSSEDKKVAEFIRKNLQAAKFKKIVNGMLSAFEWGFSAGEIIWKIEDGQISLKTVKFRDPAYMFISTDKHGNITHFTQKPAQPIVNNESEREIMIPPEKMLHYAYQSEFSNHYGISDLRAAYRAWWSKKYITQFYNIFLERFGAPLMMMKYQKGSSKELKDALKLIMEGLSSKTDILVPEGVAVELIEATRAGTAKYDEALTHYDIRIATAMLVPALLGMGTDIKRGSDSQSRLHLRTLMKVVQYIGDEIIEVIEEKIIKQLVDFNFNVKEYPTFVFQDYGEFESFEITDAIIDLHNAGILELDGEDTNYIRSILALQLRDEGKEDEVKRPEPTPLGSGPMNPNDLGAGAKKGNDRAGKSNAERKTDRRTGQRRK